MAGRRFFDSTQRLSVKILDVPYVPSKVLMSDLSDTGSLLSKDQHSQLEAIKAHLTENRRYTRKEIQALLKTHLQVETVWPYSLIQQDSELYVIYKGSKHGLHLGRGAHGKVKIVQRVRDLKFHALKIQLVDKSHLEKTIKDLENLIPKIIASPDFSDDQRVELIQQVSDEITAYQVSLVEAKRQLTNIQKEFDITADVGDTPHRSELALRNHIIKEWDIPKPAEDMTEEAGEDVAGAAAPESLTEDNASESRQVSEEETPSDESADEEAPTVLDQYQFIIDIAQGLPVANLVDRELQAPTEKVMGSISGLLRLYFAYDAMEKLDILHRVHSILHLDLQPNNIFLDIIHQTTKKIDYGLSMRIKQKNLLTRSASDRRMKGSTLNLSPRLRTQLVKTLSEDSSESGSETSRGEKVIYDDKAETYAMGITLAELFNLREPIPDGLPADQWGSCIVPLDDLEEYLSEFDILDIETYKEVYSLIVAMTHVDDNQRILLSQAKLRMLDIIQRYKQRSFDSNSLDIHQPAIPVHVVDVKALMIDGDQKPLIKKLSVLRDKGGKEIWLISGHSKDVGTLIKAKRLLEEQGFAVGDKCFVGNPELAMNALKLHLAKRPIPSVCHWESLGGSTLKFASTGSAAASAPVTPNAVPVSSIKATSAPAEPFTIKRGHSTLVIPPLNLAAVEPAESSLSDRRRSPRG